MRVSRVYWLFTASLHKADETLSVAIDGHERCARLDVFRIIGLIDEDVEIR